MNYQNENLSKTWPVFCQFTMFRVFQFEKNIDSQRTLWIKEVPTPPKGESSFVIPDCSSRFTQIGSDAFEWLLLIRFPFYNSHPHFKKRDEKCLHGPTGLYPLPEKGFLENHQSNLIDIFRPFSAWHFSGKLSGADFCKSSYLSIVIL